MTEVAREVERTAVVLKMAALGEKESYQALVREKESELVRSFFLQRMLYALQGISRSGNHKFSCIFLEPCNINIYEQFEPY